MAERTANQVPALKDVAHAQTDELRNVSALLNALLNAPERSEGDNERLAYMALQKVDAAVAALEPHI